MVFKMGVFRVVCLFRLNVNASCLLSDKKALWIKEIPQDKCFAGIFWVALNISNLQQVFKLCIPSNISA
jgi:hypothetical protein